MRMVDTSLKREFRYGINLKSLQCFIDLLIDLLGYGDRLGHFFGVLGPINLLPNNFQNIRYIHKL